MKLDAKLTPAESLSALIRDCEAWETAHAGEDVLILLGRAVGLCKSLLFLAESMKRNARRWFGLANPAMPIMSAADAGAAFLFGEVLRARATSLGIEPDWILDELPRLRALPRRDPIADCTLGDDPFFMQCEKALRVSKVLADNGLRLAFRVKGPAGERVLRALIDREAWEFKTVEPALPGEQLLGLTYEADPEALERAKAEAFEIKELFDAMMVSDPVNAVRTFQVGAHQAEKSVEPSRWVILQTLRAIAVARAEVAEHDDRAGRAA